MTIPIAAATAAAGGAIKLQSEVNMIYKEKYYELEVHEPIGDALKTPAAVVECLQDDFSPLQEKLILLIMDIKNNVVLKKVIAQGGQNALLITPKDIFRYILMTNGCNFIIAHNHPSNDTAPSREDIIMTKKLEKAAEIVGLGFLDHIIFTADDHYSMKKHGLM